MDSSTLLKEAREMARGETMKAGTTAHVIACVAHIHKLEQAIASELMRLGRHEREKKEAVAS
jgi:hypothetical protein